MADVAGKTVAGYPLDKPLEQGSYVTVYQAKTSEEPLRVLLLRDDLMGDEVVCQTVAAGWAKVGELAHQNLLRMFAVGVESDVGAYCLEENVRGKSLRKIVLDGMRIGWRDGLEMTGEMLAGLKALHDAGLTHGDLWPGNVLITQDMDVKLEGASGLADPWLRPLKMVRGAVAGYFPPERLQGAPASVGADLYAVGATFYFMLGGRDPFPGRDASQIAEQALKKDPVSITAQREDVPEEGLAFLARLLAKDPTQRYGTAADVLADLGNLKAGKPLNALKGGVAAEIPPPDEPERVPTAAQRMPTGATATVQPGASGSAVKAAAAAASSSSSQPAAPEKAPPRPSASGHDVARPVSSGDAARPASSGGMDTAQRRGSARGSGSLLPTVKGGHTVSMPGKLKTHVKSTIAQSDLEKEGDEQFNHGHLAAALVKWDEADKAGHGHAALSRKLELGRQDLGREQFETAVSEAKFAMGMGDYDGAHAAADRAHEMGINILQKESAQKLKREIDNHRMEAQKVKSLRQLMLALGGAVAVLIILALILVNVLVGDDDKPPPGPGEGAPPPGQVAPADAPNTADVSGSKDAKKDSPPAETVPLPE